MIVDRRTEVTAATIAPASVARFQNKPSRKITRNPRREEAGEFLDELERLFGASDQRPRDEDRDDDRGDRR